MRTTDGVRERCRERREPNHNEPGHPGDFCEEYQCVECGRTGEMVIEHYPVANEYSTVPEFDRRMKYTGILRDENDGSW